MKKSKKILLSIIVVLVVVIVIGSYGGIKLTQPSYSLAMDVNPSIEIVSNRLDRVVEINPLNDDAREMLQDFKIKDKDLEDTIEDLADLMVLKGYISGGEDNLVMITVTEGVAKTKTLDKLNKAIAAYLENKQIEALIVNQSIPNDTKFTKSGKDMIAGKMLDLDDRLDYETLSNMTLRELVNYAEANNIEIEKLFTSLIRTNKTDTNITSQEQTTEEQTTEEQTTKEQTTKESKSLIGDSRAKEIALGKINGEIVDFEFDWDDGRPEYKIEIVSGAYEYEIEIDGYTGQILEFEKDDLDDDDD